MVHLLILYFVFWRLTVVSTTAFPTASTAVSSANMINLIFCAAGMSHVYSNYNRGPSTLL